MGSLPEIIVLLSCVLAPLAFIGGWLLRERSARRGRLAMEAQLARELRVHHELRRLGAAPAVRALLEPDHSLTLADDEDETTPRLSAPPRPRPPARPLPAPATTDPDDVESIAAGPAHEGDATGVTSGDDGGLPPLPPPVRVGTDAEANENADEGAHFDATSLATWPDSVRGTTLDPARLNAEPKASNTVTRQIVQSLAAIILVGLGWAGSRAIWPVDSGRLSDRATRALSSLPGGPEPALAADRPHVSPTEQSSVIATPAMPGVLATAPSPAVESDVVPGARAMESKPAPSAPTPAPVTDAPIEVTAAQLCASLTTGKESWRCDPVADSAGEGIFYFYTRLRTTRATKVRHVWYRDNEVRRAAELTLAASGPEGYRTYSRMPIASDDAGAWRVELRDEADRLLHEARLVVR